MIDAPSLLTRNVKGCEADSSRGRGGGSEHGLDMTPENMGRWCFSLDDSITSRIECVSAAIWRFDRAGIYDLERRADVNTDVIPVPISGQHHHPYFGHGRQKWAMEYLEAHLGDDVGLEGIASLVGASTTYLASLSRHGTGEGPHRWFFATTVRAGL
jgi:hypothetical protein